MYGYAFTMTTTYQEAIKQEAGHDDSRGAAHVDTALEVRQVVEEAQGICALVQQCLHNADGIKHPMLTDTENISDMSPTHEQSGRLTVVVHAKMRRLPPIRVLLIGAAEPSRYRSRRM